MPSALRLAAASSTPVATRISGMPAQQGSGLLTGLSELDKGEQYISMLEAYRQHGGLARGEEVADLLRHRNTHCSISTLARSIVTREVLSFQWHTELWLPLFQFNLNDMSHKDAPRRVTAELAAAFDAWNLSCWFVQPNSWLKERMPLELIARDADAVLHAAKADRFVAMG
jgi:hypothetical protein